MVLLAADQWGTPHFRITLAGYAPPLLPKGHAQLSVRLAFQNQTQSPIDSPVLHRSLTTGAASLIFMPFGAPKGHTKHNRYYRLPQRERKLPGVYGRGEAPASEL
jgi:hypothetical protein